MPIYKPRGSLIGLKKNREETRLKNTEAMLITIELLRKTKPQDTWTYKEVWTGAGLKSNVALKSSWNSHVRKKIDEHNKIISEFIDSQSGISHKKNSLIATNKELKLQILILKIERDKALSQIAVWEAEADYYHLEHKKLLKINERLNKKLKLHQPIRIY